MYKLLQSQKEFLIWLLGISPKQYSKTIEILMKKCIESEQYTELERDALRGLHIFNMEDYLYYVQSVRGMAKPHNRRKKQKQ